MNRKILPVISAVMIAVILGLSPSIGAVMGSTGSENRGSNVFGSLDAWVTGKVMNATTVLKISCQSTYSTGSGNPPVQKYYNGTTDLAGNFNITVDSNTWGMNLTYSPVGVFLTGSYHESPVMGKDQYFFVNATYSGNASHVPSGVLDVFREPTSNLTIKILNGSSGEPLENTRVEIVYPSGFPNAPFNLADATNSTGEVFYNDIRSVNTTIDVTKLHFQPLEDTEEHDYVVVQEGGDMHVTFDLMEEPWPFSFDGGITDVNATKDLIIDFHQTMAPSSITDENNYQLLKVEGSVQLDIDVSALDSNSKGAVDPVDPLEFDTVYRIRLDTPLRTEGGGSPLWRAMEIMFRTELPPGQILGTLISSADGSPVPNVQVSLLDQIRKTNSTGNFHFSIVPDGTYRIDVIEGFLYDAISIPGINIEKGQILDLGSKEVDPKSWGSLQVNVMSGNAPLENAWVRLVDERILPGEFNLTTDADGSVNFPRVMAGVIILKIGADHHAARDDMVLVHENRTAILNATLVEDEMPVWMEAETVNTDGTVDPQSTVLLHVPEAIVFSSLNVTMWRTDADGVLIEELSLMPPERRDDLTYIIDPPRLRMESHFSVFLGSGVKAEGSMQPLIWRDIRYDLVTPDYALSYINGSVLFEGMVLEGFEVEFGHSSDVVDKEGGFNISIDLSENSLSGELAVNGSIYGYGSYFKELEVFPGTVIEVGNLVLQHIDGWYILDPAPGSEDVDPDSVITLRFMRPIIVPDAGNWSRLISVIREGKSAPIPGVHSVSDGNTTVLFTPSIKLENNIVYRVRISEELLQENGIAMFPLGNISIFKVEPPEVKITVIEPAAEDLDSVKLDQSVLLSFSFPVRRISVEENLDIDPLPEGLALEWPTSTELEITMFMLPDTGYTISIPPGVYGTNGEPIKSLFKVTIMSSSGYSTEHNLGSVQGFPDADEDWDVGQQVKITGTAPDAVGWTVTLMFIMDGSVVDEFTSTVGDDGSWNMDITAPMGSGTYDWELTVATPGAPAADTWTGEVKVKNAASDDDDDDAGDGDNTLMIAVIIIVVLLIIIVGAVLYAFNQRKKAQEEIDSIEYDDVESEWDQEE
ncbi:MAG: Ig-like domain-containing protein [Candidatus Thermoplasmatota archaeon]|nr:Ig-like domain-containing protein [Candidatus Thermoplasmatota archaeon]